jgi:3-oxoacyl-[acyl-carrier-protein] synthase II
MRLPTQNMIDELIEKYPQLSSIGEGKVTGLFIGSGASEWAGASRSMVNAAVDHTTKIGFMGLINIQAGSVAHKLNIRDYLSSDATACVSSLKCIEDAKYLLEAGVIERAVILGWDDQMNGPVREVFYQLGASIKADDYDKGRRPSAFNKDENNGGFLVGAGIGYIVLEQESDFPIAEVLGISTQLYGFSNPLSVYKEGYIKTMTQALKQADNPKIDTIKSHGTGTCDNDIAESEAIAEVCGHDNLVTSYKSIIGHTMGASGAIELSMLLDDYKRNTLTGISNKSYHDQYINVDTEIKGDYFLSNAAGMGGVYTSVVGKWYGKS